MTNKARNLKKLADSLPYINTIYLDYNLVREMSLSERQALKAVFPAIKNVFLLDHNGDTVTNSALVSHYRWSLGDKSTPTSLFSQCAFFVRNKLAPAISTAVLPEAIQLDIAADTASDSLSSCDIDSHFYQ